MVISNLCLISICHQPCQLMVLEKPHWSLKLQGDWLGIQSQPIKQADFINKKVSKNHSEKSVKKSRQKNNLKNNEICQKIFEKIPKMQKPAESAWLAWQWKIRTT